MKILFFGDSITDACRARESTYVPALNLGCGFVQHVAGRLCEKSPTDYEIVNTGIAGNRVVDLYARVKQDCWDHAPDLISILIGVNDVWHDAMHGDGEGLDRFARVYRMMLEDTIAKLPDARILLCEPFVLKTGATEDAWDGFATCTAYAEVVGNLAKEYGLYFLPLQQKINEAAAKHGAESILFDGVHPSLAGAVLIANEWLKKFETIKENIKK